MKLLFFLLAVQVASGVKFTIVNKCGGPIWPGIQGSTLPEGGGFRLEQGQSHDIFVPDRWEAGRFWTRTWCDDSMNCGTGFCGVRFSKLSKYINLFSEQRPM